jgi:hypothetical protein
MSRPSRFWIGVAALSSYLLVTAVLLPLHRHRDHGPLGHAAHGCCHAHHGHGHEHKSDDHQTPAEPDHDDCLICFSLSQPSSAAPLLAVTVSLTVQDRVSLPTHFPPAKARPRSHPSRGPPLS